MRFSTFTLLEPLVCQKPPKSLIFDSGIILVFSFSIFDLSFCVHRTAAGSFSSLFNFSDSDVLYTPLPLYHSAATMIGCGCLFQFGSSMVLRKKFSASRFSKDCKKFKCTAMQYIGELARYLIATPEQVEDSQVK